MGANQTVLEDAGPQTVPAGRRASPRGRRRERADAHLLHDEHNNALFAVPPTVAQRHPDLHAGAERQRLGYRHRAPFRQRRHGQRRRRLQRHVHDHGDLRERRAGERSRRGSSEQHPREPVDHSQRFVHRSGLRRHPHGDHRLGDGSPNTTLSLSAGARPSRRLISTSTTIRRRPPPTCTSSL